MAKSQRARLGRWYKEAVEAEDDGLEMGVVGRTGRFEEQLILQSIERLVRSVGLHDLRIHVRVSPRRGGRDRGIEVKITGPYRGAALRAIREDLRRLKQAK